MVSIQLVPQRTVLRPCFLPDDIVERVVLQQVLAGYWDCIARTSSVRFTDLKLCKHVGVHPVVFSPEPEQDDLGCFVQVVVAVRGVEVKMLLAPLNFPLSTDLI